MHLLLQKPSTKSKAFWTVTMTDTDGKPKDIDKPTCKLCFKAVKVQVGNTSYSLAVMIMVYHVFATLYHYITVCIMSNDNIP